MAPRAVFFSLILFLNVSVSAAEPSVALADTNWPCYILKADRVWHLNPVEGERFDASGLLRRKNGDLLTVNDRGASLFQIPLNESSEANLKLLPDHFTSAQLAPFAAEKFDRYDCEGLAEDAKGRLYVCEEANRWILRFDPKRRLVERLDIDWRPVLEFFHSTDRNASFEGIAIGDGKLFVANERQEGRIIVVDLKTLKVLSHFTVRPTRTQMKDIHYSDLCWFEGALYAILRENRVVVKIDPKGKRIVAEYNFFAMEQAPELVYQTAYPTSTFEGLAVDKKYFWLVTDNNGWGRKAYPDDSRPALFRCARPDR